MFVYVCVDKTLLSQKYACSFVRSMFVHYILSLMIIISEAPIFSITILFFWIFYVSLLLAEGESHHQSQTTELKLESREERYFWT